MPVLLNPYLAFDGTAREAIEFYQQVFGGELTIMTFAEGGMQVDPAAADRIMHAQLSAPNGLVLMASDGPSSPEHTPGEGTVYVSLSGDDEATLRSFWDGLVDGATVLQPLEKAPWGDTFGMLVDRFGTSWLVNIAGS